MQEKKLYIAEFNWIIPKSTYEDESYHDEVLGTKSKILKAISAIMDTHSAEFGIEVYVREADIWEKKRLGNSQESEVDENEN